ATVRSGLRSAAYRGLFLRVLEAIAAARSHEAGTVHHAQSGISRGDFPSARLCREGRRNHQDGGGSISQGGMRERPATPTFTIRAAETQVPLRRAPLGPRIFASAAVFATGVCSFFRRRSRWTRSNPTNVEPN